jgi:hypothetical protein
MKIESLRAARLLNDSDRHFYIKFDIGTATAAVTAKMIAEIGVDIDTLIVAMCEKFGISLDSAETMIRRRRLKIVREILRGEEEDRNG